MNTLRTTLFFLSLIATAVAKYPSHEIVADVESVSISENKILLVLNGTIRLTMYSPNFSGGNPSAYERPLTILYHVPLTILRRDGADAEAAWNDYREYFSQFQGKRIKCYLPMPSYQFERDRIVSITATTIWIDKEKP